MCRMPTHNKPKQPEQQPYYTRRTLSTRWVCSIETLKRMERAGRLPHLKIGRGTRYRPSDIERIEREAEVC